MPLAGQSSLHQRRVGGGAASFFSSLLKDVGYFQRFFLEVGTVTWPNGADIAPETLHEHAISSEGL